MAAYQGTGTGGSTSTVSALSFPAVPYNYGEFHPNCDIQNYKDAAEVRNCWLVGLPDLNQTQPYVQQKIVEFLNDLIGLGVAGFRVDAAKHMWPNDLAAIYSQLVNVSTRFGFEPLSRPFLAQEVIDLGGEGVSKFEYNSLGTVTEFLYSSQIGRYFRGLEPLKNLQHWTSNPTAGFLPSQDAFVFVDNHDNQRGHGAGGSEILTYKDAKLYKAAVAFMLAHPYGIVRIMSSFAFSNSDQGPPADSEGSILSPTFRSDGSCDLNWVCEHRWRQVKNMIAWRNAVGNEERLHWWDNADKQIAFARGNRGFVAFNLEYERSLNQSLQTGLPAGEYCDLITGYKIENTCTGKTIFVNDQGMARIFIAAEEEDAVLAISVESKRETDDLKSNGNSWIFNFRWKYLGIFVLFSKIH